MPDFEIEAGNNQQSETQHEEVLNRLQATPELMYPGGASASGKYVAETLFGEQRTTLRVKSPVEGTLTVSLDDAARLLTLDTIEDVSFAGALGVGLTSARITALHAALPAPFVILAGPTALLALMTTVNAAEQFATLYPEIPVLEYKRDAVAIARDIQAHVDKNVMLLTGHGVIVGGRTAHEAYDRLLEIVTIAENAVQLPDREIESNNPQRRQTIATLRKSASEIVDYNLAVSVRDAVVDSTVLEPLARGLPAVGIAETLGGMPHTSRDLPQDAIRYGLLDSELGAIGMGDTIQRAKYTRETLYYTLQVIRIAEESGGYAPTISTTEAAQVAPALIPDTARLSFSGEVCLVTGAASGIGKACVEAFLDKGAAVVGLDINPDIETIFDRPDYLGIVCDITDADAVADAYEAAVKDFGGLDMLVLNAGVFPKGTRIADLALEDFMRVMHINLDANVLLMHLAHPLLVLAPGSGRVVINGSRNALAPGPGAAAYSTSKAALTQLGRVAALEWGSDGIRINMIHAHAVFDTGLWTPEVLAARAAHYGITVEEYKTNNLLRTEVKSRDVGELAAAMCGPLFARTTGAQVPIDGGSDRVI